eukprot:TRINITY_DN2384_c0_g1_i1.p1 TRINITY_DN2384_c0_g1~~TRINITY_DN2384_c0_g1_i1.p1  ORF type:complete len:170 (-),score=30.13 TRINITY_DN2384_c0_g1_i1:570-1079(-)
MENEPWLLDDVENNLLLSLPSEEGKLVCELYRRLTDIKDKECAKPLLQVDSLVRFLRGREHVLDDAEKMVRDSVLWRANFQLDERLEEWKSSTGIHKDLIKKYWSSGYYGVDKRGLPVHYTLMGRCDPGNLATGIGSHNFLMLHLVELEFSLSKASALAKQTGFECCRE